MTSDKQHASTPVAIHKGRQHAPSITRHEPHVHVPYQLSRPHPRPPHFAPHRTTPQHTIPHHHNSPYRTAPAVRLRRHMPHEQHQPKHLIATRAPNPHAGTTATPSPASSPAHQKSRRKEAATSSRSIMISSHILPSRLCMLPLLLLLALPSVHAMDNVDDRVHLLSLPSLTFIADTLTTARRTAPHDALACLGGTARGATSHYPTRVECYNVGVDVGATPRTMVKVAEEGAILPKWQCVATVHPNVRISSWRITCEGYSYAGDAFVLRGSCWLGYQLAFAKGSLDATEDAGRLEVGGWGSALRMGFAAVVWMVLVVAVGVYAALVAYQFCAEPSGASAARVGYQRIGDEIR